MDIFDVLRNFNAILFSFARFGVVKAIKEAWASCQARGVTPQEPDFVASLVVHGMRYIYNEWEAIFRLYNIDVSIASVYCHQTPKVHFNGMNKSSCELGDLLFVRLHTDLSGQTFRNALLFQAKVSSQQPYEVHHRENDQLTLYYSWPEFTYRNSGDLTGKTRNVIPKMPHRGAQYLLIDDRFPSDPNSGLLLMPGTYPVGSCMAAKRLYDHSMLESELLEFLSFRSGRPFLDLYSSNKYQDGWSLVVWDLLKVGMQKAFNRKRSGFASEPRLVKGNLEFLDGAYFANKTSSRVTSVTRELQLEEDLGDIYSGRDDIPPDSENPNMRFSDEGSGVSVVLIETRESEE